MTYTIAVRALCDFTARQGDLDLRFTPAPSAQDGIEGHSIVAARRGAGYEKEIALEGGYGELRVRGRADGYNPETNQLEEFKTYRGDLQRMPDNHRQLHWAQVRIYGALLCRARGLQELRLALVYFDVATERETVLVEACSAESLEQYFTQQCERFMDWAQQETAHRAARDAALSAARFPFAGFHAGQRELAESVYRTVRRGGALLAQAPTGIGKTIGTVFPALKAMPTEGLDRLFCLVAKTPGRKVMLDALARIAPRPLRVLEMVARDKSCEFPDRECHGDSCPLARGFYDRLPAARHAAARQGCLDRQSVRDIALAHQICPYYLAQELMRWSDVVVGDFNYYFDWSAPLYTLTLRNQWKVCVLVDEAHNLLERTRQMYSASLDRMRFDTARRGAPAMLRRPLAKVARAWNALLKEQPVAYQVYERVPEPFLRALEAFVTAFTDFMAEHPTGLPAALLELFFEAGYFCRLAAELDEDTLFDVTRAAEGNPAQTRHSTVCLRNIVPARFLAPRWAATRATVLFSATLSPPEFHRDVLGLPRETGRADVASPFSAEQLSVRVVHSISTRFRHRARSVGPIVRLIASQFAACPGNYLAFFGSFDYLNQVAAAFEAEHPRISAWRQQRGMPELDRREFLDRFVAGGQGIGFAVLGGAFAEGVDLPGERLIGAFIATLGLPQVNEVNEEMQRRMELRFGTGYEYTYLYPGLQKVVQAAGRVIRTPEDRGVVYLIDDRFAQSGVRQLFPGWWKPVRYTATPTTMAPV